MTNGSAGQGAQGLRVVVVGGSMGGLLAGNMLHRAGCDVTVHERIGTELAERGVGIATHPGLHAALESLGLSIDEAFGVRLEERITLGTDGSILARYHLPQIQATWGHLYHLLRGNFPDERYVAGANFTRVEPHGEGVLAHFADGSRVEADLLIGADGVRSTVRAQLWPEAVPEYAGYVAWRGIVDEDRLSAEHRDILLTHFIVCLPPGEHVVGYPVAGPDGDLSPGKRRFNIVWYRLATADELRRMQTDEAGNYHEAGIAPDLIARSWIDEIHRAAEERLPPALAEPMTLARGLFFQTIVDLEVPQMVQGRVAMLGDAAFSARPHTGMGVVKGDRRRGLPHRRDRGLSRRAFARALPLRCGADALRALSGPLRPPPGHAYRDPGAQRRRPRARRLPAPARDRHPGHLDTAALLAAGRVQGRRLARISHHGHGLRDAVRPAG